jgi:hypothetical protein
MPTEVDWNKDAIIPRSWRTAIYLDDTDNIVIRQNGGDQQDDDIIVVPKLLIGNVVVRLNQVVGIKEGWTPIAEKLANALRETRDIAELEFNGPQDDDARAVVARADQVLAEWDTLT